jgi:hypothetical protein
MSLTKFEKEPILRDYLNAIMDEIEKKIKEKGSN